MFIDKEELLNKIKRTFGDLTDDKGAFVSSPSGEDVWLSVSRVVDIINTCDECED